MSKGRIVVVEDEGAIRRGVVDALRVTGYDVREAGDGLMGQHLALEPDVDLVLLDLLLPKRDGLSVLAEIRRQKPGRPVIVLTARGTVEDRIKGLSLGADDYVVKPFSARELLARVEAVLRRTLPRPADAKPLEYGSAAIDLARREVRTSDGSRLDLSETETGLLKYLFAHRARAVSRDELLEHVWGVPPAGLETRTVDMHVARLRAKLREAAGGVIGDAIVTVRSLGYMAGPDLAEAMA